MCPAEIVGAQLRSSFESSMFSTLHPKFYIVGFANLGMLSIMLSVLFSSQKKGRKVLY